MIVIFLLIDHFTNVESSIHREWHAHKQSGSGKELPTRMGPWLSGQEWKVHVDEFSRDRLKKHSRFSKWIVIALIACILLDNSERFL